VTIGTPGSFVVQFTATPSIPGTFANPSGGGVCAADPDGVITESDERNNNCSDAVSVVAADLQLTNGISGGSTDSGSNVSYLITVTNNGPSGANNVVVTDNLPANVTFVSCTPSAGTCSGGASVAASLGSLANGAQANVTIVAKINCNVVNGAVISNTASVTSSTGDPNLANNTNITTFTASNQVPVVNASVAVSSLTQNNHELINVGLAATASDGACPAPTSFTVRVFGNEDDQTPTAQNEVYSPDAKDIAVGTLRLRAERVSSGDGRVYLIVVKTTDAAGGAGFAATAVVVPKSTSAANVTAVNNQAAVAVAFANANNGNPPAGYFVIGDGPIVGQKQ